MKMAITDFAFFTTIPIFIQKKKQIIPNKLGKAFHKKLEKDYC